MRSASARPTGLTARRNRVPPPKMKMIASTPSISIPGFSEVALRRAGSQCFRTQRSGERPGLHELDRFDRAERDGDLGVVATGRAEVDLVGGHVRVDAHRDADDLG